MQLYMYICTALVHTHKKPVCLSHGLTEDAGVPREEGVGGAPGQSQDQAALVALHTVVPATRAFQLQAR